MIESFFKDSLVSLQKSLQKILKAGSSLRSGDTFVESTKDWTKKLIETAIESCVLLFVEYFHSQRFETVGDVVVADFVVAK